MTIKTPTETAKGRINANLSPCLSRNSRVHRVGIKLTRKRIAISAGLILAVMLLYLTRFTWLPLPARWLLVNEAVSKSDVIFPLSGDTQRLRKAAELFHKGFARKIIVTGGGRNDLARKALGITVTDAQVSARVLEHLGVPRQAIIISNDGDSTYEEAVLFREYVRRHRVQSVIIVTSNFHGRRASWTFRKVLKRDGVRVSVINLQLPGYEPEHWWQSEDAIVTVFSEYIKFFHYLWKYSRQ